jgi:arylsulfatase
MRAAFDAVANDTRVLVAHGGAMCGYSVYLKAGVPVYCYNLLGGEMTYVRGTSALPAGRHELTVQFRPDSQGGATVTLAVDRATPAQGTIRKLSTFLYEASDGFSVGLDQGSPVSPETTGVAAAGVEALRFEFSSPVPSPPTASN